MKLLSLIIAPIIFTFFINSKQKSDIITLTSPDYHYKSELHTNKGIPSYKVYFENKLIIDLSSLRFKLSDNKNIFSNTRIGNVKENKVHNTWKPVYGERSEYPDNYNKITIGFISIKKEIPVLNLTIRAYNEGIAFRYEFADNEKMIIEKELTSFTFPQDVNVWISERAQGRTEKGLESFHMLIRMQ